MAIRKLRFTTDNEVSEYPEGQALGPDHGYDIDTETGEVFLIDPELIASGRGPVDVSFLVPAEFLLESAAKPGSDLNEVFA